MSSDYISQWKDDIKAEPLTRQSFLDLLDGKIPFIREAEFVSRHVAQKLEDVLLPHLSPYTHVVGPPLLKVGVAQFEFQAQAPSDLENRPDNAKERYFLEAEKSIRVRETMAESSGQDVWQAVIDRLRWILPDWDIEVASEGPGQRYFSGIVRSILDSTPIHCDWSPYDSRTEDWIINRVTSQGVFNLYLTPFKGGQTVVHDVQWSPDALRWRDPDSYGYLAGIVEGRRQAVLHPQVSELYMFNSRNMHHVCPVQRQEDLQQKGLVGDRGQRMTLSSFFGTLPTGNAGEKPRLILWS